MGSPTAPGPRLVGGRYRLLDKVGSGGMGTVWRAHDDLLDRIVAVKEVHLPSQLTTDDRSELRLRTMREARAAARLSHPNAVTIHDVIKEDGQPWIVMQLVAADSLADVINANGPLPPRRVAAIGLAILSALEAAHAAGILHRDVKPANVLLSHDGRIVLTDFGVATLEGDPAITGTGLLLGSPAFIAPERALGQRAGPPSDLWALGATLYAAVEGHPPFERDTPMAVLAALITEAPPRPMAAGPLTPLLAGLLRRDPERRLDASGTRELLQTALTASSEQWQPTVIPPPAVPDERVETTSAPVKPPSQQSPRRRLRTAMVSGLVLAAIAALVATVLITTSDLRRPTVAAKGTPSPSRATPSPAPSPTGPTLPELPTGFSRYYDQAGWSIGRPAGWSSTWITDAEGRAFSQEFSGLHLWVTTTKSQGDPLAYLQQQHRSRSAGEGYQRHLLANVKYRSYQAADWEYTEPASQTTTSYRNRVRVFTVGRMQYEIRLTAPTQKWQNSQQYFTSALDSFSPPG